MTPSHGNEERPLAALLAPDIIALLGESPGDLAAETEEMHPADLADVAEVMTLEQASELLRVLPADRAADVLEYLDEERRTELLEAMTTTQAAQLVSAMTPDDRADALEDLEESRADEILSEIPAEARRETEQLLAYRPDTAGGLMTTEFVSVPETLPVEDALVRVRALARTGRKEAMYAIYATDEEGRLRGVLSLRELLAAPEGSRISDIAWQEVATVGPEADRADVARMTAEYDLVAVPVVDEQRWLHGVVTVDDVIDAIVEEQTEDVQKLGAVQPLEEPYFQTSLFSLVRKRAGWLVILFIGEMFTGTAMRHYEDVLAGTLALTLFIPLIISSGGNSGSQSASLITRALAVGDVEMSDALRVFRRELVQGVLLGLFLGAIGYVRAIMWVSGHDLALVVGLTLWLVVIVGATVGAMLPLVFRRIGFDPAIASSPFVASLVDVTGILIYFSVARQLLRAG